MCVCKKSLSYLPSLSLFSYPFLHTHTQTHTHTPHIRSSILTDYANNFCHLICVFFSFEEKFMLKINLSDWSLCFLQILLHLFSGYAVQVLQIQFRWIMILIMYTSLYLSMFCNLNSIILMSILICQLDFFSIFLAYLFIRLIIST